MIGKVFFSAAAAAILASTMATAQAKTSGSPLGALNLKGHWVCTQSPEGGTFNEDWSSVFNGQWLRATDSAKGVTTAEHMVRFDKASSTWVVLDSFATGSYDVLHAATSSPSHIAFHAVYPTMLLNVVYNRTSATQYTLDISGNIQGKKLQTHDACTKH